jgi:hypothetical protein
LTASDIRADVLVLGEMAPTIRVELVAPDGTTLTPGSGADEVVGDAYRVLRVVPADVLGSRTGEGRWEAVLSVDGTDVQRWLRDLRERLETLEDKERAALILRLVTTAIQVHGVPYTLSVQARSGLRMRVDVSQHSRLPGPPGRVRAALTDSGIPLGDSVTVRATITAPDGTESTVPMQATEPGVFAAQVQTSSNGVYRILTRSEGADLHGVRFTREELRTLAVWARGDDPPPVVIEPGGETDVDTCGLLLCLLGDEGVARLLENHGIDAKRIAECVRGACG